MVFHGQRTTDLIFLQLISAAWRRIPSLSVPQQNGNKWRLQSAQREAYGLLATSVSSWILFPPLQTDPEQHSDPKKNQSVLFIW